MTYAIEKTEAEWKALLAEKNAEPLAYHVTRKAGTERAFSGKYEGSKAAGTYHCICCGLAMFSSLTKYESGSGWPSFYQPLDASAVQESTDHHLGYARTEIHCPQCGAHIGHVFPDGPDPTGLRYCTNSASLELRES